MIEEDRGARYVLATVYKLIHELICPWVCLCPSVQVWRSRFCPHLSTSIMASSMIDKRNTHDKFSTLSVEDMQPCDDDDGGISLYTRSDYVRKFRWANGIWQRPPVCDI